ncbi:type IV pilus biogenesis protein PilM [Halobacillus litoralis]|uniref:type IV pilus biogenesis protein PilM n=1 Tax=Halobacillus litoralis TaxID=45668 RepID=UPI001CFEAE3A|nr:pilus assembly protein PilM [Halobacillus litoralis]
MNLLKPNGRVNFVIKNHCIRYTYSTSPDKKQLDDSGEIHLPSHVMEDGKVKDLPEFTATIENFVENKGWKKKALYFTVPDHSVVIRPFDVPSSLKEDEMKGYLYMQLGETLHLPFENPSFDYIIINSGEEIMKLLLFAYPEEQIRTFERVFKQAKLKPKAADISALSIFRLYEQMEEWSAQDHLLVIDWNMDGCVLTVFHQDRPAFINHTRSPLPMNLWKRERGAYVWQGQEGAPLDFTYDQINEIERIMDFYRFSVMNGKAGVSKVLITGDWPEKERVMQWVKEKSIPAVTLDHSAILIENNDQRFDSYIDAVGLSMKP